jgi:hypothetical protein
MPCSPHAKIVADVLSQRPSPWYHPAMQPVIRHIRDIDTDERRVLEHVIGRQLKKNQKVIIQVVTLGSQSTDEREKQPPVRPGKLPGWCNVFAGLTEKQVADVEEVILQRADLTRSSA